MSQNPQVRVELAGHDARGKDGHPSVAPSRPERNVLQQSTADAAATAILQHDQTLPAYGVLVKEHRKRTDQAAIQLGHIGPMLSRLALGRLLECRGPARSTAPAESARPPYALGTSRGWRRCAGWPRPL